MGVKKQGIYVALGIFLLGVLLLISFYYTPRTDIEIIGVGQQDAFEVIQKVASSEGFKIQYTPIGFHSHDVRHATKVRLHSKEITNLPKGAMTVYFWTVDGKTKVLSRYVCYKDDGIYRIRVQEVE